MAKKKMGGLGKGLDSLFADLSDDTGSEASGSTLLLREIEPDPEQPRKRFDDDALNQLADSIVENGLLQPIAVRPKRSAPGTSSLRASAAGVPPVWPALSRSRSSSRMSPMNRPPRWP